MPKQNYHQARKQKEFARKARQEEKQQRRSARAGEPGEIATETPAQAQPLGNSVSGSGE